MDEIQANYISIFKIDGIPILPPLMTEEKRLEMKQYRELAIEKENGIKMRLSFCVNDTTTGNNNKNKDHNDFLDELLAVTNKETDDADHLQKPTSDQSLNSNRSQQCALEELNSQYLQISSLLHCNANDDFNNMDDQNRLNKKYQSMINIQNTTDDDDITSKNQIEFNNNNNNNNESSIHTDPDLSFIESKQIVNKDPFNLTELSTSFPNYNTRPGSSSTILDTKRSMTTPRKLVRSNSYTLESPSPMFVKHMESKGINLSTSWIISPETDDDTLKFNRQLAKTKPAVSTAAIDLTTAVTVTKAIVTNKEIGPKKPIVKNIKPKIVGQQKKCTSGSIIGGQITSGNNKLIKFRKSPYDLRNSKSQIGNYSNKPVNRNASLNGGKKRISINVTSGSVTNLSAAKNTSTGKKCLPQPPPPAQKKSIDSKTINNKLIKSNNEINNEHHDKSESISFMSEVGETCQQPSPSIRALEQPSPVSANIPTNDNNNNNNSNNNLLNQEQLKEILKRIEESHKNQINLLIERQQEEHEKLQIDFYEQQKRLIKQLKVHNTNNNKNSNSNSSKSKKNKSNKKSLSKSMSVSSSALSSISTTSSTNLSAAASSRTTSDVESIICSTTKSIKSLTFQTEDDHNNNNNNNIEVSIDEKQNPTLIQSDEIERSPDNIFIPNNNVEIVGATTPNCHRKLQFNDFEQNEKEILQLNLNSYNYDEMEFKRHKAASIINAYVRGYLIRRLFKTELVQSIIQTIRDTLLFILDLHDESKLIDGFVESPVDLKLKRTLLQRLNSACDKIQDIFNERDITDKLLIIRKDRELLKRKVMKSKLNQSFNKLFSSTSTTSSSSAASSTATALELHSKKSISNNKLERIELFSVNIKATSSSTTTTAIDNNSLSEIPLSTVLINSIDRTQRVSPTIQTTGIEPKRSESLYIPAVSTSNRNKIILPQRPATSKIN